MSAGQRRPNDAVQVEIDSACAITDVRRDVHLSECGLRRIGTWYQPDDVSRLIDTRETNVHRLAPDRIVHRTRLNAIECCHHARVFLVEFPIAVGVHYPRSPALRSHLVSALVIHPRVPPARPSARLTSRAGP